MNKFKIELMMCVLAVMGVGALIQPARAIATADSVMGHAGKQRLSVGGYGEVAYSREFYSDNVYRYSKADAYKKDQAMVSLIFRMLSFRHSLNLPVERNI